MWAIAVEKVSRACAGARGACKLPATGSHFRPAHVLEASCMRGSTVRQLSMLSAVTPDELVPVLYPIRRIRPMVELALDQYSRCHGPPRFCVAGFTSA